MNNRTIEEFRWISRIVLWNDRRAFEKLLERYQPQVNRFFLLHTHGDESLSDDLTQETFIKVWLQLSSFKMLSSFSTWLYRIAYNEYMLHCRRHRDHESLEHHEVPEETPVRGKAEEQELIQRLLYELSPPERTCLTLFYLEEQSIKQIAKITGWAEGTIKSHLSRGRESLRKLNLKETF